MGSFSISQVLMGLQLVAGSLAEKKAKGIHQGAVPSFRLPLGLQALGPLNWKGACPKESNFATFR